MKKCSAINSEVAQDGETNECFIKLAPLDPTLLIEEYIPPPNELVMKERSSEAITEAVTRILKEAVFKDVKKKIGEAVALELFDQWWAKGEEKYKMAEEKYDVAEKLEEDLNGKCHLCEFQADSEGDLTEHLMIDHVFDL